MRGEVGIGVVGIGYGQQVHVPAFRSDGRCRVVGICASTSERARAVASRLAIPRAFGDWRALVAAPEIAAAAIAVPPPLQAAIVRQAAAEGKHVFCEKPVARTAAEARAMLVAVAEARVVHAVDFLFPEVPAWQETHAVLRRGVLGALRQVALTWRVETYAHRMKSHSWKLRSAEGGGTLNNFVSQSLYALEWLFGPIARVAARLEPRGGEGDARVDAWLEFAGGVPGTLSVAADAFLGPGHRLEVYGEEGTLVLENRTADHVSGFSLAVGTRAGGVLEPVATPSLAGAFPDGRTAATAAIARRFVDAIGMGGAVTPSLADGLRVQHVLDATRCAAASAKWQEIGAETQSSAGGGAR